MLFEKFNLRHSPHENRGFLRFKRGKVVVSRKELDNSFPRFDVCTTGG